VCFVSVVSCSRNPAALQQGDHQWTEFGGQASGKQHNIQNRTNISREEARQVPDEGSPEVSDVVEL